MMATEDAGLLGGWTPLLLLRFGCLSVCLCVCMCSGVNVGCYFLHKYSLN